MKVVLFFIFLIVCAGVAKGETIITVDILKNGDAIWTMEKRLPLTGQAEIDDWEAFVNRGHDEQQYQNDIAEFKGRIAWFINSAKNISNRSMGAEKFNISYGTARTLDGAFSIIRYGFEWKNFSRIESSNILIGDAFSEGMMLSSDNMLIIKIPEDYDVLSASPDSDKRDGDILIWEGRTFRSFNRGEPALILSPASEGQVSWYIIIAVMFGLVSGASLVVWRRRRSIYGDKNDPSLAPGSTTAREDIWGEEMTEQYLIKCGGQAYQSDIVKESGLSKSKISSVLSKMKKEGRIIKIKKGKENIIRLVK